MVTWHNTAKNATAKCGLHVEGPSFVGDLKHSVMKFTKKKNIKQINREINWGEAKRHIHGYFTMNNNCSLSSILFCRQTINRSVFSVHACLPVGRISERDVVYREIESDNE